MVGRIGGFDPLCGWQNCAEERGGFSGDASVPQVWHAFGLRRTKLPVTEWSQLVETWLRTIGIDTLDSFKAIEELHLVKDAMVFRESCL
jgi:hypothetical protein